MSRTRILKQVKDKNIPGQNSTKNKIQDISILNCLFLYCIQFNKCLQNFKKCLKDQNKNKIWQKNINTNAQ